MTATPASHPLEVQKNSGATSSAPGEHYVLGVNAVVGEPLLCQVRCMSTPCKEFPWRTSDVASADRPKQMCRDNKLETAGENYDHGPYDAGEQCHVVRSIRNKWRSAKEKGILFTLEDITKEINTLEQTAWIDELTCQIMLKLVVFLPLTDQYLCMHACAHARMHARTHTFMHACMQVCTRTHDSTTARQHA